MSYCSDIYLSATLSNLRHLTHPCISHFQYCFDIHCAKWLIYSFLFLTLISSNSVSFVQNHSDPKHKSFRILQCTFLLTNAKMIASSPPGEKKSTASPSASVFTTQIPPLIQKTLPDYIYHCNCISPYCSYYCCVTTVLL